MRVVKLIVAVLIIVTACTSPADPATITGTLVSGPHCPVEVEPPDPGCAPRPVGGATVVAESNSGHTETVSSADGRFTLVVAAGSVTITFAPVEGLLAEPSPITLVVAPGEIHELGQVTYDTGVR